MHPEAAGLKLKVSIKVTNTECCYMRHQRLHVVNVITVKAAFFIQ